MGSLNQQCLTMPTYGFLSVDSQAFEIEYAARAGNRDTMVQ